MVSVAFVRCNGTQPTDKHLAKLEIISTADADTALQHHEKLRQEFCNK